MIDSYLGYLGVIISGVLILRLLYTLLPVRITQFVPLILIIYMCFMLLSSSNFITQNDLIKQTYTAYLKWLPAMMIFLMLLQFRLGIFLKLGKKMILTFFATTLSIIFAFVVVFYSFKSFLFEEANSYFAVLAGSWSGGTANMLAVASAIQLNEDHLGPIIAVDSILYALWLMFLLALVPLAPIFNNYTKSNFHLEDQPSITPEKDSKKEPLWMVLVVLLLSASVTYIVIHLVTVLPKSTIITESFLTILFATLLGLAASFTKLNQLAYSDKVAKYLLYFIVALIASKAAYTGTSNFELFFFLALLILLLHALIMFLIAKRFKLDLFSIGLASLSHIGGVASAPILASAYHRVLIPIGIAMATAGYLLGTVVGIFIAYLLGAL